MSETELPDDSNLAEFMQGKGSYIRGTIEIYGEQKKGLVYKPNDQNSDKKINFAEIRHKLKKFIKGK